MPFITNKTIRKVVKLNEIAMKERIVIRLIKAPDRADKISLLIK